MSEFPPAPEPGHDIYAEIQQKPAHVGSRWKALIAGLVVAVLIIGVPASAILFLEPATPAKPVVSASPSKVRTIITRDALNAKMNRVAFYLGRGQVNGAKLVLDDMLRGSDCVYVTSGAGAYSTQRYALKVARLWARAVYNSEASGAPLGSHIVIGTGIAEAEDGGAAVAAVLQAASGPWVSAGIALYCPDNVS